MTEPHKNGHETSRRLQDYTELLRRISSALMGVLADEAVTVYSAGTDEPSERGIEGMERMRLVLDDIETRAQKLQAELTGS